MCAEIHYLFRRCGHTRFLRWEYCSVILPLNRIPATGSSCRRYRLKYKDNQEQLNCFECIRERMALQAVGEDSDDEEDEKSKQVGRGRRWLRRVLRLGL
jgi:hypothetical protein